MQQTLARMAAASPDMGYAKVNPEVEAFLVQNAVEPHAASQLRCLSPEQQQLVIQRSLCGARDPTAVIIGRIRNVARGAAQMIGMKGHFQRSSMPQTPVPQHILAAPHQAQAPSQQFPVTTHSVASSQSPQQKCAADGHRGFENINKQVQYSTATARACSLGKPIGHSSDSTVVTRKRDDNVPAHVECASAEGSSMKGVSTTTDASVLHGACVWHEDLKSLLRSGDSPTGSPRVEGRPISSLVADTWMSSLPAGSSDDEGVHTNRNMPGDTSQRMHASLMELKEWLSEKDVICPGTAHHTDWKVGSHSQAMTGCLSNTDASFSSGMATGSTLGGGNICRLSRPFSSQPFTTAVVSSDPDPLPDPLLQTSPPGSFWFDDLCAAAHLSTESTRAGKILSPGEAEAPFSTNTGPISEEPGPLNPPFFESSTAIETCHQSGMGHQSRMGFPTEVGMGWRDWSRIPENNETVHHAGSIVEPACGLVAPSLPTQFATTDLPRDFPSNLALAQQIEMQHQADLQMQYHKFWVQQQMAAQMSLFETQRAFGTGGLPSTGGDGARKRDSNNRTNTQPMLPGDWNCPDCGDHQFARNHACRACGAVRPPRTH